MVYIKEERIHRAAETLSGGFKPETSSECSLFIPEQYFRQMETFAW